MFIVQSAIRNLETQVWQIAEAVKEKNHNTFLSDTKRNPRDCMAIALRSGKKL